jgi:Zn-dependent protease/predicted transcriptional regulator
MSWSLKLFSVRGIPVRVHISFLLIVFWAAYVGLLANRGDELRGAAAMVVSILLLFLCVVLHELGHSLVAQLFGVSVSDITLWPIGGVARMSKLPERPYQEFLIAAAGPATNVLLALGFGAAALMAQILFRGGIGLRQITALIASPLLFERFWFSGGSAALLLRLVFYNVILAVFNLIPAFPMDGGRLLRSLLAAFLPFSKATRVASVIGQVLAVVMVAAALLPPGNFLLAVVGFFVFIAAGQERLLARTRVNLRGLRVRQVMQPIGPQLHPLQTLGDAATQVATKLQAAYLVMDGGRLAGVLTRNAMIAGLRRLGAEARVAQHMSQEFAQLGPGEALEEVEDRLLAGPFAVGVVVEDGQVLGILNRGDLLRVAELANSYPGVLPRQ